MKKKTIVFSCLAALFLLSSFSGFAGGLVSGGVGCLVICGVFAFLAFRSAKPVAETSSEVSQTPNSFTTPPNKSSFSQSLHDNTVNTDTAKAPAAAPVPSAPAPQITETIPFTPPISAKESTTTHPATVPDVPDVSKQFEYLEIKVAGVTFKNDKGLTRQTILRKIHFNDKPFDEYVELGLHEYEFDGKPAFGVYANNMQIGNIPADYVQFIIDNDARYEGICGINVYGGGRDENGYAISYGCKITLKYRKQNNE